MNNDEKILFGEFIEEILNTDKYFDTVLPRIPLPVRKSFQAAM